MPIQIAARPVGISGCMSAWNEKYLPNTIRSEMDDLTVKVRRRTTGLIRNIDTQVTLKANQYQDFVNWFKINQQGGSIPTRITTPGDHKEIVVRAKEPPTIQWVDAKAFTATMSWEVMPGWEKL